MVLQVGNIRISAFCSLRLQAVACRACVVLDASCKPESWSHRTLSWEGPNLSGSHPALLAWHYLAAEVVRRRVTLCWRAWTKIPKMLRSMAQPSNLNLTGHSMARQCALLSFSSSLPASPGKPDPRNSSCVDLPTIYPHITHTEKSLPSRLAKLSSLYKGQLQKHCKLCTTICGIAPSEQRLKGQNLTQ